MLAEKVKGFDRKPIVEIKITGQISEPGSIQSQISRLANLTLRCFWKHVSEEREGGLVFANRPVRIEDEMQKIAREILGSAELANFAIAELLPLLSKGNIEEANQAINDNYNQFKKGLGNVAVS